MRIAFKIPPHTHDYANLHLLAEAGKDEISFLIFTKSPLQLQGFYTYSFNKHISDRECAGFIKEIVEKESVLQNKFASVNIFYNRKECTPVPTEYFSEGEKHQYCNLLFGEDKTSFCFYENAKRSDIKVVYRVPSKVHDTLRHLFPSNIFAHSVSMQVAEDKYPGNVLECTVYHNTVKMLLFKAGKLQAVQYAEYAVPADVCYHLLNLCERYEILPTELQLLLSGMVDEHSNLYKDIYRYFLHVAFLKLPPGTTVADKLDEHPHHFYSHLSALAQCV